LSSIATPAQGVRARPPSLGGRVQHRVVAKPLRAAVLTASAFLVAGAFTVVYWDVRALNRLGYLWFPTPPWP
jgi:hypothetical protein